MSKTLIKKKSLKRDETSALVKSVAHPKTKISVFIASLSLAASVGAAPSGEQVVAGSASFAREGASLEVQNTNGTIINWQDFSIAQDEMVRFLQSGADSAVLNRVISGIPSEILGSLTSNGRVFLINPNGLVIGDGATIDTASFVASTLNISNADFLAGNLHFEGDGGAIENHGYIASGPGGEVVLIAPTVENHGLIQSEDGRILLAAGREVTLHSLNEGGISYRVSAPGDKVLNLGELVASNGSVKVFADQIFQSGTISANRAYRDAEGRVVLEADNELSVSGRITVTGEGVDGGSIHLLGDQVDVVGAEIDASGESGGEILIGGDYQGKGDVKNAENTNVDESTTIRADAGNNGDGGRVIIWSDDTTNSFARITARGGLVSGDGGFVETSGKKILNFGQPVDVSAINGRAGTWLLDPEDITIGDSEAASISTALNGGSNVEVRTTDEGDGEGNIYVNSAITKTEGDSEVTLTLDAHNRVEINAPIRTTAGPLNVTIKTGRAVASTTDNTVDQESTANQTDEPVEDNDAPQDDAIEQDNEAVVQDEETSVETESEGESETSEEATEEVVADATQESEEDQETQDQPDEAVESDEVAVTEDEQAGDAESTDTAATEEEAQASSDEAVAQEGESDASAESTEDVASQETSVEATEEPAAEEASTESSVAADTTETPSTETEADTGDSVAADASESVETSTSEEVASDTTTEAGDVASDDGASDVEAPEVEIETVEVPDVAAETEATDTGSDVQIEESVADAPTETEEAPAEEPAPEVTQTEALTEESEQQIVIAAEIDTGGGDVAVDAGEDGDVIVGADIDTSDEEDEEAGDVTIEGERIAVVDEATISASANNAGDIKIGGGRQGRDETVSNSQITILAEGTSVEANGGETGDGGSIIVFSEESSLVSGNLSARGGSQSGNGGFIETSGLENLTIESTPDVGANNGEGGEWLIDPNDILITDEYYLFQGNVTPNISMFSSGWNVAPTGTGAVIEIGNILNALETGDVTITTDNLNNDGQAGNITVESLYGGFTFDGPVYNGNGNTLTLNATNNIYFNSQINFRYLAQYSATYSDPAFNVAFIAGGDIFLNETFGPPNSPPYAIDTEGSITIDAGGSVFNSMDIMSGGGSLTNDGVYISAGVDVNNFRTISSHGTINISAGNDVNIEGRVSTYFGSYADIDILAGREAVVRDSIETYGNINITGGLNMGGDGQVFILDDLGRNISVGLSGSTSSTSSVNITGDDIFIRSTSCTTIECGSGINIQANDINLTANGGFGIEITANANVNDTNLASGGQVSIISRNEMNINSASNIQMISSDTEFIDGQGMRSTHIGRYGQNDYFANQIVLLAQGGYQNIQAQGDIRLQTGLGEMSNVFIQQGPSYYGPGGAPEQTISAGRLLMYAQDSFAQTGEQADGAINIHSAYQQTITSTGSIRMFGRSMDAVPLDPYQSSPGPLSYGSTSNVSITSFQGQTITATTYLDLYSAEIASISDPGLGAQPADSSSSVTVQGSLVINNGRIGLDRDPSLDSSSFTLTTNNVAVIRGGADTAQNPDNFAFQLDSVDWVNNGSVFWDPGAGDVNIVSTSGNPAITNHGNFFFNSEEGVFSIVDVTPTATQVGLFLNEDGGRVSKFDGTGVTNVDFRIVGLDGSHIDVESGELNFGANDIVLTGMGTAQPIPFLVTSGGNLRTTGSVILDNAEIFGGRGTSSVRGEVTTGGSIIANVQITNSFISPGFSPGTLTIDGNLDASGGGNVFNLEVDADTGLSDQLVVTGDLQLPATSTNGPSNLVNVIQTGEFDPDLTNPVDSSVTLISAGSGSIDPAAISNSTGDASITSVVNDVVTEPGSLSTTFSRDPVEPPVEPPVEEPPVEPPVEEPPVEPPVEEPPVEEPPVEPPVEEPPVEPPVEEPPVEPPVEEPPVEPPVEEPPVEPPVEEPQTGGEESQELGADITDTIVGETPPVTPEETQETPLDSGGTSDSSEDEASEDASSSDDSEESDSSGDDSEDDDSEDDDEKTKKKSDTTSAKNNKSKKKKKTPMCSA